MRRLLGLSVALVASFAAAQPYPAKPIRMISPVPAGSGIDVVARIATDRLAQNLGVAIVVDNIAGAASTIGAAAAARAAPDGYTLLFWSEAAPLAALANPKLTFDPIKDLHPVGSVAKGVFFLAVNPTVAATSVAELIQLAKAKPGTLAYGSSGIGSPHHVVTEMFVGATGIQVLHVPYKGSSETVTSLLRGDVQFALGLPSSFAPHLRSGKFRGLAVAAPARSPAFPDLPTVTEIGVKGVEYLSWYAVFAPAGTPRPILERLHAETAKIVADRAYIEERLGRVGLEPYAAGSLEETMKLSQQYYDMLAPVVRKAEIKQD